MNCRKCTKSLEVAGRYKPNSKICKQCQLDQQRAYRASQRAAGLCLCGTKAEPGKKSCFTCLIKYRERAAVRRTTIREETFAAYGGRCRCCGESRDEFLTIDHVVPFSDGGGPRDYRGATPLYAWLRRNGYPDGFRILCMNCNFSRANRGYCPHQTELGFADFVACKRPHVMLAMSNATRKIMDKVLLFCETSGTDLNMLLEPVLKERLLEVMQELDDGGSEETDTRDFD